MEDGELVDGRDDVFTWRGMQILQPLTTMGDDGEDIFTVVEYDSGRLLYCGPDLVAEEADDHTGKAAPSQQQQQATEEARVQAALDSAGNVMKQQRETSRGRVQKAKEKLAEFALSSEDDDSEKGHGSTTEVPAARDGDSTGAEAVVQTWTVHVVGGKEWKGVGDPALWNSLLTESVEVAEVPGIFRWKGMNVRQPARDGDKQRIETEDGDLVFYGVNPNEAADFPSEEDQKDMIRAKRLAKMKIVDGTQESDFGTYKGGTASGKRQGDGAFTVCEYVAKHLTYLV